MKTITSTSFRGHRAWRHLLLVALLTALGTSLGVPAQAALAAGVHINNGSSVTVEQGDSVTVRWTTIDATSATGWTNVNGTPVPFPNWDSPKALGVGQSQQLTVDLPPGTYYLVLEAGDGTDSVARSSVAVTVLALEEEEPEEPGEPEEPLDVDPVGATPPNVAPAGSRGDAVPRVAPRAGTP